MNRFFSLLLFILLGSLLPFFSPAFAAESSHVTVQLIQEGDSLQPGQPIWIATHLTIDKGWHIYWKDPGDVGIPLKIEWKLPAGYTMGTLQWSLPEKFVVAEMTGYGYEGEVTLLSQLTPPDKLNREEKIPIEAHLTWLACSTTTCQPGGTNARLDLKTDANPSETKEEVSMLFKEARAKLVPATASASTDTKTNSAEIVHAELTSTPPSAAQQADSAVFSGGVGLALLFAFMGGLLLNLMPCVLPVISFKIMSFVKMAGESRSLILKHGLIFSLGVILSFWLLASFMLILRAYGQKVGWGFQLQEPLFVVFLASILFIFSLSLFGVFEWGISFSSWAGQTEAEKTKSLPGYMSSFFSGVLATAVATPCTGPFLGSAVGFAVTLPVISALSIFTSLALGMCAPYLLLSAFPSYLRFMPKPGAWMETFKQLMAFSLLATVLWLLWVFSAQTDTFSLMCVLAGFLCFAIAAWVYGKGGAPVCKRSTRLLAYASVLLLGWGGSKIILFPSSTWDAGETKVHGKPVLDQWEGWEEFSPEKVIEARSAGKPVLIDFTAKWCLICQANHLVLSSPDVKRQLNDAGVVKMRADWTKSDPTITAELSKFGRNSVPLYVLYGSDEKKEPQILPQVLTPAIVSSHIDQAVPEIIAQQGRKGITRDKRDRARERTRDH